MPKTTVQYGGNDISSVSSVFDDINEAIVRFSEAVCRLDKDPERWAAWATIEGSHVNAAWTKVSNERPTSDGETI